MPRSRDEIDDRVDMTPQIQVEATWTESVPVIRLSPRPIMVMYTRGLDRPSSIVLIVQGCIGNDDTPDIAQL
ncbi:hypothetical protein HDU67_007896 [Dinochytrium kinnereticum]|nr:hypothetical protein HDU67_007896 [Dinochytrium kinnereticum]